MIGSCSAFVLKTSFILLLNFKVGHAFMKKKTRTNRKIFVWNESPLWRAKKRWSWSTSVHKGYILTKKRQTILEVKSSFTFTINVKTFTASFTERSNRRAKKDFRRTRSVLVDIIYTKHSSVTIRTKKQPPAYSVFEKKKHGEKCQSFRGKLAYVTIERVSTKNQKKKNGAGQHTAFFTWTWRASFATLTNDHVSWCLVV